MDRFVVGSGRCGSTLLSRMLDLHPEVTSIFEFFNGLDVTRRFAPSLGGAELAELLSAEQAVVTAALRRGHTAEEVVYPFGREGARYRVEDALPWLCVAMAPRLTDDPDTLFDDLVAWARTRPEASAADHYRALFDWLCARKGTRVWIERSGSSVDYAGALATCFPEARFLHIHRDGPETALSMREHGIYRLPIAMLYDVLLPSGRRFSTAEGVDFAAPPDAGDWIFEALETRLEPEVFGRYWSDQVERGARAAAEVGPERFGEISFEALVDRPRETLAFVAAFFELPPEEAWLEAAAALVRGRPPGRRSTLGSDAQRALDDACAPGRAAIRTGREKGIVRTAEG